MALFPKHELLRINCVSFPVPPTHLFPRKLHYSIWFKIFFNLFDPGEKSVEQKGENNTTEKIKYLGQFFGRSKIHCILSV